MSLRFSLTLAVLAAAYLLPSVSSAAAGSATRSVCGYAGYSYAGFQSPRTAYGVAGRVRALATPAVENGHVAAWVGVGGLGMGPRGTDEWVQAGIATHAGTGQELYYEYARPGMTEAAYISLGPVAVGEAHDVAVRERATQPGTWRVWLDGRPVSPPIGLPGSHGAWRPIATAETWDGGIRGCNHYSYAFSKLAIAAQPTGGWQPFTLDSPMRDPGFSISARPAGFAASTLSS